MKHKLIICSACILALGLSACTSQSEVVFKIDGQEKQSDKKTIEYEKDLSFTPKDIGLTAYLDKENITKKITYKKVKINELKTYKIKYQVNNQTFTYEIKVVDTTAPTIHVEDLTLAFGTSFSYDMLDVLISDNFDHDLNGKIQFSGDVDTNKAGSYPIKIQVKDRSGNQAKTTVNVLVKENYQSPTPSQNQQTSQNISTVSNPSSIQVLINKNHKLPDDYAPNDLVNLEGNHYLRQEAATQFITMKNMAATDGINMNLVSSYRTKEYQANLYNNYYASDPINAPFYSALPRTSEHELGLAVDISYDYALHEDLQNSSLGKWMANNAHKYGWIMRYPYGKSNVTGYIFEAWHYRYVGVDLATKLKNSNLTLEEYYG